MPGICARWRSGWRRAAPLRELDFMPEHRQPDKPVMSTAQDLMNRLIACARDGDTAGVASLVEEGLDPNQADCQGATPLSAAMRWDRPDIVRLLLDAGADPNMACRRGDPPVMRARSGSVARLLLDAGADP